MLYLVMRRRGECMTAVRIVRVERDMGTKMWIPTAFSKPFSEVGAWEVTQGWEGILVWEVVVVAVATSTSSLEETQGPRASLSSLVKTERGVACVRVLSICHCHRTNRAVAQVII